MGGSGRSWSARFSTLRPLYAISDVLMAPYPQYPADLRPGDRFRILFVSDTNINGWHTDVSTYDGQVAWNARTVPAEAGCVLVWILLGCRALEDGRWRAPGWYSVFSLALMSVWSFAPIDLAVPTLPRPTWLFWVVLGAFAEFLLRGRHDEETAANLAFVSAQ